MDHLSAYSELAADLERFRRLPHEELARRIADPPLERSVESQEGPVTIEVRFGWEDAEGGPIRVTATAYGPSWWRLDQVEEAVTVKPPDRNA